MDQKKGSKGIVVVVIVLVVFAVFIGSFISNYNKIISSQENVQVKYSDIDAQLQRRLDLIPNLLNSVKGYMEHETAIIDSITESREKLMNANTLESKMEANEELTKALNSFNVIVENYPDLKASSNFIQLQDELAGTENRIAVARKDYNDAVGSYNQMIKRFPGVIIASLFGFEPAEYFSAQEESKEVPNIEF